MSTFIAVTILGYGAIGGLAFLFQRSLLYHPGGGVPSLVQAGLADMEQVGVETEDGLALLAWYRAARDGLPTILYLPGNAGHIGYRGAKVRPYLDAGYGMLLLSYRGYGGNPGRPNETGLYRDGRAALKFLARRRVTAERVVLYGESLGTGVAVELATSRPVAAIVLEAPFSSIADVAARSFWFLPVRWLVLDRFDSRAKIGRVRAPIFILQGARDRIIAPVFGRKLFAAAPEPKEIKVFPHAGHNDLYDFGAAAAVIEFLRRRPPAGDRTSP